MTFVWRNDQKVGYKEINEKTLRNLRVYGGFSKFKVVVPELHLEALLHLKGSQTEFGGNQHGWKKHRNTWKIQNTKHKTWFQWTVASFFGMNLMALGYGISFSPPRHWIPATLKSKGPYEKHGFALWRKHAFGWSLKTNRAKLKLGVLNVKPCAGSTYCDGREQRLFATRRWLWVTAQMQKMQSCFVVRLLWNCIYI